MYLIGKLNLTVYSDASQTAFPQQKQFDVSQELSDTAVLEAQNTTISLAASATQNLNFNGVDTVTGVYLYSDTTDLSVALNGGSSITYKAMTPGYFPLSISSISITNASGSLATTVTVMILKG